METLKSILREAMKDGHKTVQEDTPRVVKALFGLPFWEAANVFDEALGTGWLTNVVANVAHNKLMKSFNGMGQPEGQPFPSATPADRRETYTPQEKGNIFEITKKLKADDQINALMTWGDRVGKAGAETINYEVFFTNIDANPTMSDSNSLFDSQGGTTHTNAPAYGALSRAQLQTCMQTMMVQTGDDGEEISPVPKWILVHPAQMLTAWDLVSVKYTPGSSTLYGDPAVIGPQGMHPLEVIVSRYVGDSSGTTTSDFYMFADKATHPLFEIGFLNGQEAPQLSQENENSSISFSHNVIRFKAEMTFGVTPLDWRGMIYQDAAS
jgi:hypothetical protein